MKKHLILAAMAMTALFSACSNEEEEPVTTGNEVTFVIGGVDSRATTTYTDTNGFETTFDQGDKIGIFSVGLASDNEMSNTSYTVGSDKTSLDITATPSTPYCFDGTTSATFNAYYPETEATEGKINFSIEANQAAVGYQTSDFMTAVATATTGNVTLNFEHRLVLVQVKLTGISNINTVSINNVKPGVTYTPNGTVNGSTTTQGTLSEASGTATNITMYKQTENTDDNTYTYWAIIPAQTIASGDLIVVSCSNGISYSYATNAETTFTSGSVAKYSLALSSGSNANTNLVAYAPLTISKWNNDAEEAEVAPKWAKEIAIETNSTIKALGSIAKVLENNTAVTTETFGYQGSKAEVAADGEPAVNVIKITSSNSAPGNWYNNGFLYYSGLEQTIDASKTYTLKFSVKTNLETASLNIFCTKPTENTTGASNTAFQINNNGCQEAYTNISNAWVEKEVIINPRNSNTSPTSNTANANTITTTDFVIGFWPQTSSSDTQTVYYYLKDISITEN